MKKNRILSPFIVLLLSSILFLGCSKKPLVLLVPGYGSQKDIWQNSGIIDKLQENDLAYGGSITVDLSKNRKLDEQSKKADCFSFSFSDSVSTVESLTEELGLAIKRLCKATHRNKIVLVGYSLGGVVCRNYLIENVKDNRVKSLITLSSPHNGSYIANLLYGSILLFGGSDSEINNFVLTKFGLPHNSSAELVRQLVLSGKDSYLNKINKKPHPLDIQYVSIISEIGGVNQEREVVADSTDSQEDLYIMGKIYTLIKKSGEKMGDGVVSSKSQDMANIEYFRNNSQKIKHEKYYLKSSHLKALENYEEISEVILSQIRQDT